MLPSTHKVHSIEPDSRSKLCVGYYLCSENRLRTMDGQSEENNALGATRFGVRQYNELTVNLQWIYSELTMNLQWSYNELTMKLHNFHRASRERLSANMTVFVSSEQAHTTPWSNIPTGQACCTVQRVVDELNNAWLRQYRAECNEAGIKMSSPFWPLYTSQSCFLEVMLS